jgi:hypothetical protein
MFDVGGVNYKCWKPLNVGFVAINQVSEDYHETSAILFTKGLQDLQPQ